MDVRAALTIFIALFATASGQQKPNIIFIIADDLGFNDVSWHNPGIITPHMESLAKGPGGLTLESSYVQPLCTPTRSAIMSGYYPIRIGRQGNVIFPQTPTGLFTNLTLLPERLQDLGYRTHMVGKWHLGFCNEAFLPTNRGFDTFYGKYLGRGDYFTHNRDTTVGPTSPGYDLRDQDAVDFVNNNTYSSFLFGDKAKSIITDPPAGVDAEKPFFLYLAFQTPHTPLQAPQEYVDMYPDDYPTVDYEGRRIFKGMVTAMDQAIGDLVTHLKNNGLYDNTLIVFTTDNGGFPTRGGNNFPLRGFKSTLWEGGTRGVAFMHAPFLNYNGETYNGLIHATDWHATLYRAAGGDPSALGDIDGIDLWSDLSAQSEPSSRTELLYNIDATPNGGADVPGAAIRFGDMKLVYSDVGPGVQIPPPSREHAAGVPTSTPFKHNYDDVPVQLFNVVTDPNETVDVAAEHPDLVNQMLERLQELRDASLPADDPRQALAGNPLNFGGIWSPGWC